MTTLKEIGGEFAFLDRIIQKSKDSNVLVPNGDDAAVIRVGSEILAISTDTIVHGDHFSLDYFTPIQVGIKAIESSASDVVAVGAKPFYGFLSLSVPRNLDVKILEGVYQGINQSCSRLNMSILGGDTTHGDLFLISVTVVGKIESESRICRRTDAKPGDLIFVTGNLGSSMAGLQLFRKKILGFDDVKQFHLEPKCRLDVIDSIGLYANAMIDVSDGLSSEIHHICKQSNLGALIFEENVPIDPKVKEVAEILGENAYFYAYSGGEDFQLLYTIDPKNKDKALGFEIGFITEEKDIMLKDSRGGLSVFEKRGWDHFL